MTTQFEKVSLDQIEQNENSRVIYKEQDLSELMGSMKQDGLLQPVGLRKLGAKRYEAVFGNRRIMAAKKLGWAFIDAMVMDVENENDRDILNLLENIKRQNTSLAEDGRMFRTLMDRGLTVKELSARLGITQVRIETALDVVSTVPKEFHNAIVNKITPGQKASGKISATVAHQVLSMRRSFNLNRRQTRKLLDVARDGMSVQKISQVAPFLKTGTTIERAIQNVEKLRYVQLEFFIDRATADKIEKKGDQSINEYLIGVLRKHSGIEVRSRYGHHGRYSDNPKKKTG
jgi:ParB/RepB/Spo0J family partition protein